MGIRFEVTGETPEEFTQNALQAFAVLAVGLQQVAQQSANAAASAGTALTASEDPPSPPPTDIPEMEPLENPKLTPGPTTTSTATSTPSAKIKPEEISQTLAKVMTEAEKRGWNPARRRNYARQLLASVDAVKVTDVETDEKRQTFMANSHAFVAGCAAEDLDDEIPHL